jgi:serine phosphatase RsbU (regulator of sigma subunit)
MVTPKLEDSKQPQPRPKVMVLDDEQVVTESIKTLLELETDYEILDFQSPIEALQMLQTAPVDVVISDFMMPDLDGLEFLGKVKRLHPDAVLILLTGYAHKDNSIKAINEIGLFHYIEKPWDNEQLKLVIRNGLANKSLKEILHDKIRKLDKVLLQRDTLAESQETLQAELSLARQLQEKLLPHEFPQANGISLAAKYLPAMEIGGDFYDFIPLANQRLALLIADITGHGIQAALCTTLVKLSFQDFKDSGAGSGDILTGMNETMIKILPKNIFVAAMIVTIDLKSARCVIANAGVPHPIVLRRTKQKLEIVFAHGLVLGVARKDLYKPGEEVTVELGKKDCLILFTDGLSEIENENEEQLEADLLTPLILRQSKSSGSGFVDKLIKEAREFSGNRAWDDVTILAVEAVG